MPATPRPVGPETPEERILRKAADLRRALIQFGLAISPDPSLAFKELTPDRQERWLRLARAYTEIFDR